VELLCCDMPEFIAPNMWPTDSPDIKPVDYYIWELMQECIYQTPTQDVAKLRQRLMSTWAGFQRSVVDKQLTSGERD